MSAHQLPGPRVTHALLEFARSLREGLSSETIALGLEALLPDVAAMQVYIDRQEENLRTMTAESLEREREITRINKKLDTLTLKAEKFLAIEAQRHNASSTQFLLANELRAALADESIRPMMIQLHTERPRTAAGGK